MKSVGEKIYDVAVIGGGIIGCAVFEKLSQYKVEAVLFEKEEDVGIGAARICGGTADSDINGAQEAFGIRGNEMFPALCERLKVPFSHAIPPFSVAIALAESAIRNGQTVRLNTEVTAIKQTEKCFEIETPAGCVCAKVVINCAGANTGAVSKMVGAEEVEAEFVVRGSAKVKNFITVAGILPDLVRAPAVAEYVAESLMKSTCVKLKSKKRLNENPVPVVTAKLGFEAWEKLAAVDRNYSTIVCSCEKITYGEVLAALKSPLKPTSLDAVKRRTRAGTGRCRGGFCCPVLIELLSKELGIPKEKVTKCGQGTEVVFNVD